MENIPLKVENNSQVWKIRVIFRGKVENKVSKVENKGQVWKIIKRIRSKLHENIKFKIKKILSKNIK